MHIGASRLMAYIYISLLFSTAVNTVTGAALTAEQASHMMRRDAPLHAHAQKKLAVELGSTGEIQLSSQQQKSEEQPRARDHDGLCDKVFVFGADGEDDCGNFTLIQEEDLCQKAADEMNLVKEIMTGTITQHTDLEKQRPRGCFKAPCTNSANECIYLNDRDVDVNRSLWTITGTPVCIKNRFINGTAAANASVECPPGYTEIENEHECTVAASCQLRCTGDPMMLKGVPEYNDGFQVAGSAVADYNKYPTGCFVSETQQCPGTAGPTLADAGKTVFFNPVKLGISLPSNPQGTPICIADKESYQHNKTNAKETDNDTPAIWFCVANIGDGTGAHESVLGPFNNITAAKTALNAQTGSITNRQMICEMSENGPKQDPHKVGGEDQGDGAGFNRWWSGWPDMNLMNQKCGADAGCLSGSPL